MGHHRHLDDTSSISSYSSSGSSRSSSRSSSSSGSSKKSRSSQVSHSNIKSDHWAVSLMKYTAGAPFGKPMSLRKTKVREFQGGWDYDDEDYDDGGASIYSNVSYTRYAWVKPKWDDSISEIVSRPDSRSSGRRRRGPNAHARPRFTAPPHTHQHPPPFNHPPPPPHFMTPPGASTYDENPGFFDLNHEFYPPPPPHPPADSGGAPAFFDLSGGGGGNYPGKYDDWA
ncbi:hypothetical protein LY78DRAFT_655784 [Colletotrichum sublineola]|uniref:Uncharacterized protein n=1 Tax=Colletotrichum sublineola TaxID=1173701 RepID=A0A066XQN1_COLSU|nr:hypothetical protein LY78DRAFT_655784 [Colletotrichum sublineola]KDN68061.1 hypothetical protein CSUB01_08221 [Colletotrichum sublineola]